MKRDGLFFLHPWVAFIYFALMLGFCMAFRHPMYQAASFFGALIYAMLAQGKKAVAFTLKYALPVIFLTAFINPAFNHAGVTVLTYLPSGNPFTAESVLYGISSGVMFSCVILWFLNFNRVMTSDKLICLFGRVVPILSLLLSMTLRFIPKFKKTLNEIRQSQDCICINSEEERNPLKRLKRTFTVFSAAVTYSLEGAVDTSDSMKSRGYGLGSRTCFSLYTFRVSDGIFLSVSVFLAVVTFVAALFNFTAVRFFPSVSVIKQNALSVFLFMFYAAFCFLPAILTAVLNKRLKRAGL